MKELVEEKAEEQEENINFWHPLEFNIDENYEYIPKSQAFTLISDFI